MDPEQAWIKAIDPPPDMLIFKKLTIYE